ncbi:hypothetical protein RhiirA4_503926 [Rhizophagus irregularis]|uniref:Endonuclease/exonuclease/phosphatase domain-containing protein n=1 Tax=Rhizophagus irregularis TaxID=588596 RepID=A0A2I1H8X2_9GLOM|nr:hypothetical protein RhiirA4_503926 [Rhizophagus irregularis]
MGITPSKEDFIALEGYANKTDEERKTILSNAGMEINAIDIDIAEFLGANDETLGAFIRGIITICIDLSNTNRNKEFEKYLEECKNSNNAMLEQMHIEMNETIRLREEQWKLKEEYYFKNTTIKSHQIQTELGTVDLEDKNRIKKYENCKKLVMETLPDSDSSEDEKVLTWETNSNTSSDDEKLDKQLTSRYRSLNKASQQATHNTSSSTNKNMQMHEENENGNFGKRRYQSITMAITEDHDMGENSLKSKESMHKPKTADDLKYFAGLYTYQIRDQQTDQSIIEIINTNKLLEYHVNTLGKITRYGNEYTYVGFFTETAKDNFIKDGRVLGGIGQFKELFWLNKLNKHITMSITGIDEKYTDLDDVTKELEKKLGKIVTTKSKEIIGGKISMRLVMDIKCTEEELLNTWGILVNGRLIKVEPENYKRQVINQRGKINASIIGIPNEIKETNFSEQLKDAGARYWYRLNDRNGTYKIIAYFNNKEERTRAISRKIKINDQIFTWFFRTDDERNGNFRRRYGGFNNRNGQMQNNGYEQKIVTSTTQEIMKDETQIEITGTTTHNQKEEDMTMKGTSSNNTEAIDKETTTTTQVIKAMDTTKVGEDITQDLIKDMMKMKLEDTGKDTTIQDRTNIIINNINAITTVTTIINTITEETKDTTTTETDLEEATITTIEVNSEKTTKEGTEDIELMADIEWLEAINWEPYVNSTIEEEQEDKGEGGDVEKRPIIKGKQIKNEEETKKINKNQKKIKNKKGKNNNLKIGCINVRGMNDNKKQGDIRKFLAKENWDIAILTETKLKESKGKYMYKGWDKYECINSSYNNENNKNGIIIMMHRDINDRRYMIETIEGHVIKVDLLFKGKQKNIRIIGVYNPNNDKPTTINIEKHLVKWMNEALNLDYEMVIIGDFNESTKNKKKQKPLTNTIKNHGLQDIHESLTAAEDMLDTWKSGENSSRIDFIFASEGFQESIISHEILDIEDFETDHKALTVKIELKEKLGMNKSGYMKSIKKEIRHIKLEQEDWKAIAEEVELRLEKLDQATTQQLNRKNTWKIIVEIYDEEKNQQLTKIRNQKEELKKERAENMTKTNEERLEELITEYENLGKIDTIEHGISKLIDKVVNKLWRDRKSFQYKYNFKEFEEKLIIEKWGTTDTGNHNAIKIGKLINIHDRLEKRIDYGITIDKLRKHRNRQELKERKDKRAEIMRSLYEEINSLNIEINIRKREIYLEEDIGKMLNRILEKKREKINMTGLVIKENGKITIEKDQNKIKEKVLKHNKEWTRKREIDLDELEYNPEWRETYAPKDDINEETYKNLMIPIKLEELERVLQNLKMNKAPGLSGITYDFWKKSGNLTRSLLLEMFNDSMFKENVTNEWKKDSDKHELRSIKK